MDRWIIRLTMIFCNIMLMISNSSAGWRNWNFAHTPYRKDGTGFEQPESPASGSVQLHIQDDHVVIENGILQVTISKPEGSITQISYNGIQNLLEELNEEHNRGYWDLVWKGDGVTRKKGMLDRFKPPLFILEQYFASLFQLLCQV